MKLLTLLTLALLAAGCSGSATPVNSPEASPTATTLGSEATAVKSVSPQSTELQAATSAAVPTNPPLQDPATTTPVIDPLRVRLDAPAEKFSLPGESRPLPKDILQELGFFAVGGGDGDYICDYHPELTMIEPEEPTVEWMTSIGFIVCGFSEEEAVTVQIISPTGQTIMEASKNASHSTFRYGYVPELNAPTGVYTARFSGSSGAIEQPFELIVPPGPRAYWREDRLILFRFEPHETVRLYTFEPAPISDSRLSQMPVATSMISLTAWNEFVVDAGGQLIIEGIPASNYDVVGETSGEVNVFGTEADQKAIASPYSVSVLRPTEARLAEAIDIWTLTPFMEFEEPGTQRSEITVSSDDTLYWNMRWCAHAGNLAAFGPTDLFLQEALNSIVMTFTIGGIEVETEISNMPFIIGGIEVRSPLLRTTEELDHDNNWLCHYWATLVTHWPTDEPTSLEIKYELSDTVDGGSRMYAPGTYRLVITVYAGEGANPNAGNDGVLPSVDDLSLCSGAMPTRLAIGNVARVVADRVSVREGPGTDYATVYGTSIGNGRTVTILDGPVCSGGMLWWEGETGLITLTNGEQHNIVGWMAEESGGEWLLEPVR
jgi:hypothetical protein